MYGVFLGTELESGIHFVLNNHPDAQTRKNSQLKRLNWPRRCPHEEWPCVTLTLSHLYMVSRHPLITINSHGMHTHTLESKNAHPCATDRKFCRFHPNMTWHMTSELDDLTWHRLEIFILCVKCINARVKDVSRQSAVFYASYLRKTIGGPVRPPLQVRGLNISLFEEKVIHSKII